MADPREEGMDAALLNTWNAFCAASLPSDAQAKWNDWFSVALRGQAPWPANRRGQWNPDFLEWMRDG